MISGRNCQSAKGKCDPTEVWRKVQNLKKSPKICHLKLSLKLKVFNCRNSNIVETSEDRIQKIILTASVNITTPRSELAIRSKNASSELDAASVTGNSEQGEHMGTTASFETETFSDRNNTLHDLNVNDETRGNTSDEVGDVSIPRTPFDRQSHAHHTTDRQLFSRLKMCPPTNLSSKWTHEVSPSMLYSRLANHKIVEHSPIFPLFEKPHG